MTRQAYVDHREKIIVFWSPKAGCSSLTNWFLHSLLRASGQVTETTHFGGRPRVWLEQNGYRFDYKQAYNLASNAGYETLVLARHPVSRLISAYLNKFVVYNGTPITSFVQLEAFAQQLYLEATGTTAQSAQSHYPGISFTGFIEYICQKIGQKTDAEPMLDHHWNTQCPFWLQERTFQYGKILYLEDMAAAQAWLQARSTIAWQAPVINATSYANSAHHDCSDMPSCALAGEPQLHSALNFINSTIIEKIADAFKVDFDYFGYNPEEITTCPTGTLGTDA